MVYAFNEDKSKVEVYNKEETDNLTIFGRASNQFSNISLAANEKKRVTLALDPFLSERVVGFLGIQVVNDTGEICIMSSFISGDDLYVVLWNTTTTAQTVTLSASLVCQGLLN